MDTVTIDCLGNKGRFANQVFQYFFAKTISKKFDLSLFTPRWIGQQFFNINDPVNSFYNPRLDENSFGNADPFQLGANYFRNKDLYGHFMFHTSFYSEYRNIFISSFTPKAGIKNRLDDYWNVITNNKRVIVIHLRLGDSGVDYYYRTPVSWYIKKLEELFAEADKDQYLVFIASDDPDVNRHFKQFNILEVDYKLFPDFPEYFIDFYFLSKGDIMILGNSSFSFAAAMLNVKADKVYRPFILSRDFQLIDPWNTHPLDIQPEFKNEGIRNVKKGILPFNNYKKDEFELIKEVYLRDFTVRKYLLFHHLFRLKFFKALKDLIFIGGHIKYKIKKRLKKSKPGESGKPA